MTLLEPRYCGFVATGTRTRISGDFGEQELYAPSETDGYWVALSCVPQRGAERRTADFLCAYNVPHYLPMARVRRIEGRRNIPRWCIEPMFPGYLFAAWSGHVQHDAIHECETIDGILREPRQAVLVRQLAAMWEAEQAPGGLQRVEIIPVGTQCRILAPHPFQGMEGPLIQIDGRFRFVMQVDVLGAATSVEIDPAFVEQID